LQIKFIEHSSIHSAPTPQKEQPFCSIGKTPQHKSSLGASCKTLQLNSEIIYKWPFFIFVMIYPDLKIGNIFWTKHLYYIGLIKTAVFITSLLALINYSEIIYLFSQI